MADFLYIDVDAFLASIEQSINRSLVGRPVMVGGLKNERGIVYCPSYEARARGVRMGTSLFEAAKLIPDGVFLKGDSFTYDRYSQRLMNILRDHTPRVDQISPDEACLEITGLERQFSDWNTLAQKIKTKVRTELYLSTSVGVASSRVVAKIASEIVKPDNLTIVPPGEEKDFLAPLPVEKIPGIGRVNKRLLNEMGIKTIGDLQTIPEEYLTTLFGRNGHKFAAYAIGRDGPLIRDFSAVRSVNRETGLANDLTDRSLLLGHFYYLLERACRRLRQIQKKAARLTIKFQYCDFERIEGRATIKPASWDEKILYRQIKHMFDTLHRRRRGIRFVGVALSNLKSSLYSQSLILDQTEKNERLLEGIDKIRGKFGFLAVGTGRTMAMNDLYRHKVTGYELRTPGLSK
ncbi:MAG: DNA polymerase IV [FCB group bacterium]|nr:DNA polymerase IV [FCB group bacterium]